MRPTSKSQPDLREVEFKQTFGRRLKAWREERNLTQEQIAHFLNVGRDGYKKWEYGSTAFPSYLLSSLVMFSQRSISWWLTGKDGLLP